MRSKFILVVCVLLVLSNVGLVSARDVRQGDQCAVDSAEVIPGNLFVLCRTLVVDGRIEGDLMGAATTAVINGVVEGDIYMVAGQLDVYGTTGDNIHFAGPVLRIQPSALFVNERADLISFSLSTQVTDGSAIPGSIVGAGYQLLVNGDVGKGINFWGSALDIDGSVVGNVDAAVGDSQSNSASQLKTLLIPFPSLDLELVNPGLRVAERGQIGGDLAYSGPTIGEIEGEIGGSQIYTPVNVQPDLSQIIPAEDEEAGRGMGLFLTQVLREFLSLGLIGVAGIIFIPRSFQLPIRQLQTSPLPSFGIGMVAFIVSFPIFIIMFLLSLLLIAILLILRLVDLAVISSLVLGVMDVGAASIFYFVAFFATRAIVGLALGRLIVRVALGDDGSQRITYLSLFVGIAVLSVLAYLPVVGMLVNALVAFLGLGAILILLQARLRIWRDAPSLGVPRNMGVPVMSRNYETSRQFPPRIIEDAPRLPGMDNLPEGFDFDAWD